jgi:hypothetical protein
VTPSLRQISATGVPASAWRRAEAICSSVNVFFGILWSSWLIAYSFYKRPLLTFKVDQFFG